MARDPPQEEARHMSYGNQAKAWSLWSHLWMIQFHRENASDWPSILEVSSMLKSEATAMRIPKVPAFSTKRTEDVENKSELLL
ncbi:hypothetical protein FH972_003367 [Carpinus fangiana]|uniref:Uncharacterized protein n=1 Tax=Carpinus fangiana TaxID=176857 RepID=A0A5N6QJN1_9ROSI|nr:hypothetical protein FH972_003367 [Carpinus fangiana]